jgi:hypothetical protein
MTDDRIIRDPEEAPPVFTIKEFPWAARHFYLEEVRGYTAPVATTLETWLDAHEDHARLALRWLKFSIVGRWHVHAYCGECRVTSGEFFIRDEIQLGRAR